MLLQGKGISDLLQFSDETSLWREEESLGDLLSDGASSLDNPSGTEVFEHRPEYSPVIDPPVMEKTRILCGDESVYQLFRDTVIGDGDSIVHQKFSDDLIFFGVDDGVNIDVFCLQGCEIREAMGVKEKGQGSRNKKQEGSKDEGVNGIKHPSLFPSLLGMNLLFHEDKE